MSDSSKAGGHDAKAAAPRPKNSAGKAVGYSNADPTETVSGRDGLLDSDATPERAKGA